MPLAPGKAEFEQVVRAYANDLFRYLYWLCRDRTLAEDLVQETFARAWAGWEDQRDEKAVRAWLYTIARNEHARTYERKRLDVDPEVELDTLVAAPARDPVLALDLRKAFATPTASSWHRAFAGAAARGSGRSPRLRSLRSS